MSAIILKGLTRFFTSAKPAVTSAASGLAHRAPLATKVAPAPILKMAPTVESMLKQAPPAPTHKLPATADEWIKLAPKAPTHKVSEGSILQARLNRLHNGNAWNPNITLEQKVKRIQEMKAQIKQHEVQQAKELQSRLTKLNPNAWNPHWSNQEKLQAIQARATVEKMPNVPTHRASSETIAKFRAGVSAPSTAKSGVSIHQPTQAPVVAPKSHQSPSRLGFEQKQAVIQKQREALAAKKDVANRLNVLQEQVLNNPAHTPEKRLALLQQIQKLRVQNFQRQ